MLGWKGGLWVEREGWVTVMLMQFAPPPPTVHQEYTNTMVKIILTMMIRMRMGRLGCIWALLKSALIHGNSEEEKYSIRKKKEQIYWDKSTTSSPPIQPPTTPPLIVLWQNRKDLDFPRDGQSAWAQIAAGSNPAKLRISRHAVGLDWN